MQVGSERGVKLSVSSNFVRNFAYSFSQGKQLTLKLFVLSTHYDRQGCAMITDDPQISRT